MCSKNEVTDVPQTTIAPFVREISIERRSGIAKSGFKNKELGEYAINASLNCETKCLYCSSHGVLSRLKSYQEHVKDWWRSPTSVSYSNIVERVAEDAIRMASSDAEVVLSTVIDPYQRRLVRERIPRRILEELAPTRLRLRVLTKMIAVERDLRFIADNFGERATIGTSIPILEPTLARTIEPFASPIELRQQRILGGSSR